MFLRVNPPLVGIGPTAVTWVVYDACNRAGLPRADAHRLRHRGDPDPARWWLPHRGWPGAATQSGGHHRDLRQGRPGRPCVARRCGVSALSVAVDDYLAVRRGVGFKLARTEKLLGQFVAYCEAVGADTVRTDVAVAWAKLPPGARRRWIRRSPRERPTEQARPPTLPPPQARSHQRRLPLCTPHRSVPRSCRGHLCPPDRSSRRIPQGSCGTPRSSLPLLG